MTDDYIPLEKRDWRFKNIKGCPFCGRVPVLITADMNNQIGCVFDEAQSREMMVFSVPDNEVERMCIYEICPLMVGDEWPDCKTCPYADGTEGDERMKPVELRAIWDLPDGTQLVRTGIYVFDVTTIAEARDLLKDAKDDVGRPPDRFEIDIRDKGEDSDVRRSRALPQVQSRDPPLQVKTRDDMQEMQDGIRKGGIRVTDLKPCPFCGSPAHLIGYRGRESMCYYAECSACKIATKVHYDDATARSLWNRRIQE